MAKKRRQPPRNQSGGGRKPAKGKPASGGGSNTVRARRASGESDWELVHPRCARDRAEDLEEVRKMIDAGELEVALDECRWLLSGCSDCLEAHRILGEIAMEMNDYPLARAHFGYAFRLGEQALKRAGVKGPLPYQLASNQGFHEAGKGLIWTLKQLNKPEMVDEVRVTLLESDPSDPLGVRNL